MKKQRVKAQPILVFTTRDRVSPEAKKFHQKQNHLQERLSVITLKISVC